MADADEVMADFYEIYDNIDQTNVQAGNKTGSGKFVLQNASTLTASGSQVALTFNNTGTGHDALGSGGNWFINPDGTASFVSVTGTGGNTNLVGNVVVTSGDVKIENGHDFLLFSDAGSTQTFSIDGATGDLNTLGDIVVGGDLTVSTLTSGSVLFAGTAGLVSQDNANLFWADSTNRLGIGTNSPANQLHVVGVSQFDSPIILPDVNPPAANQANRNGIVKAWAKVKADGSLIVGYNVSSTSRTSAGVYTVNWNTDFSSVNYCAIAVAEAGVSVTTSTFSPTTGSIGVLIIDPITPTNIDKDFCIMAIGTQ